MLATGSIFDCIVCNTSKEGSASAVAGDTQGAESPQTSSAGTYSLVWRMSEESLALHVSPRLDTADRLPRVCQAWGLCF